MRLRLATPDDEPLVRALVGAFRDQLGQTSPADAALVERVPRALADPQTEFCCAFDDEGNAVGYTMTHYFDSLWSGGTEALLADLFVVASARRRGFGGGLLEFAIGQARARGARLMGLYTNENNADSQALYRRAGFEPQREPAWDGGREVRWIRSI